MIEFALVLMFLITVCLLAFIAWQLREHATDRRYLINHIIAKNANEVRLLNQPVPHPEPRAPRVPTDDPTEDSYWNDLIKDGFAGQTGI